MTDYLCKDCIHSRVSKFAKICSYILEWSEPKSHWYKCSKTYKNKKVIKDPVVGSTEIKGTMEYCTVARLAGTNKCGPDAKYWAPKKKKDLFKMLTKENHD
jgi:hypothetical protein